MGASNTPGVPPDLARAAPLLRALNWSGGTLRPATPADDPFLADLFRAVQARQLGFDHLPPEMVAPLLDTQHAAQRAGHRAAFPGAIDLIITCGAGDIGLLRIDPATRPVQLVDVSILPTHQGQGLGSGVLGALCAAASTHGTALRLSVLSTNPARRLYARLGFVEGADIGAHIVMERPAEGGTYSS